MSYPTEIEVVWDTVQRLSGLCPRTGREIAWFSDRENCTREQMLRYGKAFLKAHMEPRMHWLFKVSQMAHLTSEQVPIIDNLTAPGSQAWLLAEEAMREAFATLQEWHDKEVWGGGR